MYSERDSKRIIRLKIPHVVCIGGIKLGDIVSHLINIPNDVRLVGVREDFSSMAIILYLAHESFPLTPEGSSLPELMISGECDREGNQLITYTLDGKPFEAWDK